MYRRDSVREERRMSVCASCGLEILDGSGLCRHHMTVGDGWAESNRIMCDFVHRKKIPPRLAPEGRVDEFWAQADAA
jgi:hypothetical protein